MMGNQEQNKESGSVSERVKQSLKVCEITMNHVIFFSAECR